MIDELSELWWMYTIKGLVAIAFALTCYFFSSFVALHLLQPMGFLYLLVVFTFYICLVGIIQLVGAIHGFDLDLKHRWLLLADAILNLAIGPLFLMTFGFGLSFSMVVVLFGLHAVIVGSGHLILAIHDGKRQHHYLFMGIPAVWSLLSGFALILLRHAHERRLTIGVAIYSAVLGLLLIFLSATLREAARKHNTTLSAAL